MRLTRQERQVLIAVLVLLAVGWGVRRWRASHPPSPEVPGRAAGEPVTR